jgi:hypothetical protein
MQVLLFVFAFALLAIENVHATCPTTSSTPSLAIPTITIEVTEMIYGPPELVQALQQQPSLRTSEEIQDINAEISNITDNVRFLHLFYFVSNRSFKIRITRLVAKHSSWHCCCKC